MREELQHEHQLVRGIGNIPRPVMVLALGIVVLLVAESVTVPLGHRISAFLLGAFGAAVVAGVLYACVHGAGHQYGDPAE